MARRQQEEQEEQEGQEGQEGRVRVRGGCRFWLPRSSYLS
jgi:hypothetical protein